MSPRVLAHWYRIARLNGAGPIAAVVWVFTVLRP